MNGHGQAPGPPSVSKMNVSFPISGVETHLWVPPLVAFLISFVTSMAGVSGAVLLLPFQMSVLGFVSPAVSPTNLVYNLVAIPAGVLRYVREKRMVWPLALMLIAGTMPGMILGGFARLTFLADPTHFEIFAGFVLLAVGVRLLLDMIRDRNARSADGAESGVDSRLGADAFAVEGVELSMRRLVYRFRGREHACSTAGLLALSLLVGVVGGAYGIGGGAILAPLLVGVFRLPVHTVAGACLLGTFGTSVVGVAFYRLAAPHYEALGAAVRPDWALGSLFGLGGMLGTYAGARAQRRVPAVWLKLVLVAVLLFIAARYLFGFASGA